MEIRRLERSAAEAITRLALRSKAYWGYNAEFMQRVQPMLQFSGRDIERRLVYGAFQRSTVIGFYAFSPGGGRVFLTDLFVAPEMIGQGVGKALWNHALESAPTLSADGFFIESDPNAEGFYLAMGAIRVGTVDGGAGREVPLLHYAPR